MAILDEKTREALFSQLYSALDDENAANMEAFAQNFLHNVDLIDAIADAYPKLSMTQLREVMMQVYGAWEQGNGGSTIEGEAVEVPTEASEDALDHVVEVFHIEEDGTVRIEVPEGMEEAADAADDESDEEEDGDEDDDGHHHGCGCGHKH